MDNQQRFKAYSLGKEILQKGPFIGLTINYDSTLLASARGMSIQIYKIAKKQFSSHMGLEGHKDQISCIKFGKTSNFLISGSIDSTLIIWTQDSPYSFRINQIIKEYFLQNIATIAISNDDQYIIAGCMENHISLWQINQGIGKWKLKSTTTHDEWQPNLILFNKQSTFVVCQISVSSFIIYLFKNKDLLKYQLISQEDPISDIKFGKSDIFVASQQTIQIFSNKQNNLFEKILIKQMNEDINCIEYNENLQILVCLGHSKLFVLQENEQFILRQLLTLIKNERQNFLTISDDGKYIFYVRCEAFIQLMFLNE